MDGTEKTRDVSQNITSDAADAGYRLELIKELTRAAATWSGILAG